MSKFIGATADSAFLKLLISNKKEEIVSAKKRIKQNQKFIKDAKAELKSRGELNN